MTDTSGNSSWNYLYGGDEISEGCTVPASSIGNLTEHLGAEGNLLISPKVIINGHTYTVGTVLVESWKEEPVLVLIDRIIVKAPKNTLTVHTLAFMNLTVTGMLL